METSPQKRESKAIRPVFVFLFWIIAGLAAIGLIAKFLSRDDTAQDPANSGNPSTAQQKPLQIKPETIIHFPHGALACLTKDDLQELVDRAQKGEKTKTDAMLLMNGGPCMAMPPQANMRVISAEYPSPDSSIGELEIVSEEVTSANDGLWVMSLGAEEVNTQ